MKLAAALAGLLNVACVAWYAGDIHPGNIRLPLFFIIVNAACVVILMKIILKDN